VITFKTTARSPITTAAKGLKPRRRAEEVDEELVADEEAADADAEVPEEAVAWPLSSTCATRATALVTTLPAVVCMKVSVNGIWAPWPYEPVADTAVTAVEDILSSWSLYFCDRVGVVFW
jgi:hypothetical protein